MVKHGPTCCNSTIEMKSSPRFQPADKTFTVAFSPQRDEKKETLVPVFICTGSIFERTRRLLGRLFGLVVFACRTRVLHDETRLLLFGSPPERRPFQCFCLRFEPATGTSLPGRRRVALFVGCRALLVVS